ncbi:MAG: DegT/DnrJ/EryC1/StrS family aminotransferase [Anaerolineae bacterium]
MIASGVGIGSEFGLSKAGGYRYSPALHDFTPSSGGVSYVANGRAALGLAIRRLRQMAKDGRDGVLLPAYLCHSMIQPFREQGLRIGFYPVASDLSIDPADVSERIDTTTLAVLWMHYFGFGQPLDLLSPLAKDHPHVAIIDDRTHMLGTDLLAAEMRSSAAVHVYSARKWGPFPDLGLVIWPKAPAASEPLSGLMDGGYDFSFVFWRFVGVVLRTLYFAFPVEPLRGQSLSSFRRAEDRLDRRVRVCQASAISRFLWHHWQWADACRIRRANFRYLLERWAATDASPLCGELPDSVCPLGFPIRTADRERLRQRLIAHQIFPPVHWLRPAQVPACDFPQAAALAEEELTIPIDQRYTWQHMDRILETVG